MDIGSERGPVKVRQSWRLVNKGGSQQPAGNNSHGVYNAVVCLHKRVDYLG